MKWCSTKFNRFLGAVDGFEQDAGSFCVRLLDTHFLQEASLVVVANDFHDAAVGGVLADLAGDAEAQQQPGDVIGKLA